VVKLGVVWARGEHREDSPPGTVAFLVGPVRVVVAAGATGWALAAGRPPWQPARALLGGALAPVAALALGGAAPAAAFPAAG
jgi:hypothetical protein